MSLLREAEDPLATGSGWTVAWSQWGYGLPVCTVDGTGQTRSSEVENRRTRVPVPQPGSQEHNKHAHVESIVNPLLGRFFLIIPELVVKSWKVCLQGWKVGDPGACISSSAR